MSIIRFIPTHAGNAPSGRSWRRTSAVHPHARGERGFSSVFAVLGSGSSPRTWGTRQAIHTSACINRFIPTHVGNASRGIFIPAEESVHPHARGEREDGFNVARKYNGSSPRTWGTQLHDLYVRDVQRFIPTHVGNAAPQAAVSCRGAGSSPRTWGTPPDHRRAPPDMRFIPTHVGNALPAPCQEPHGAVHPHARGERSRSRRRSTAVSGSSPRTWGTRPWRHRRP